MKLAWKAAARLEALDIRASIARNHPRAAREWLLRLDERVRVLVTFPKSGRTVPEYGEASFREIIFGDYRVWYYLLEDRIEIARIWDARRQLPEDVREAEGIYRLEAA